MFFRLFYSLLLIALCCSKVTAQSEFTLSTSSSLLTTHVQAIVIKAYRRIGIDVAIKPFPTARSLVLSNNGITDGELLRVKNISDFYPNLLIVPIPLHKVQIEAYSLHKAPDIKGLQSLKATKIGIIRGAKTLESSTKDMQRVIAANHLQLFELLKKKRIEVAIASVNSAQSAMAQLQLAQEEVHHSPLKDFPVYHFVHKKHRQLIPALTQALTDILQSSSLSTK